MTRGVPQRSVLGPLLFIVDINDLEENVAGLISKFADDTKIGGVVDSEEDCQRIQQDINRLETWTEKWQMEFNPDKSEIMHFGRMHVGILQQTTEPLSIDRQRDLGIHVH